MKGLVFCCGFYDDRVDILTNLMWIKAVVKALELYVAELSH